VGAESHAAGARPDAGGVRVESEPLGGSALSRAIQEHTAPAHWHTAAPTSADAWRARIRETQAAFADRDWLAPLAGAISGRGPGRERLERVARAGGIVVTTGQQPGLFGGPIYTWSKALTALALADEIERRLGVPAAPLFWAATDDADLVEAQRVWVATATGAVALHGGATAAAGTPAARVPQGDLRRELDVLRSAAGSAASSALLNDVTDAYGDPARSIGDAYLAVLDATLAPLGIPVLNAAHPAVADAGATTLRAALRSHEAARTALAARGAEIRALGLEPQVEEVPGLTTVFLYDAGGTKRRIPDAEAAGIAERTEQALGPNVLLRPVMEAAILPTAAYVAGPGELAYFAQVTALAEALGARVPVAVPRWSGTVIEPRMQRLVDRLGVSRDDLADPHRVEVALARDAMPAELRGALAAMEARLDAVITGTVSADATGLIPPAVADGLRRRLAHQVQRFERRVIAAAKRREADLMRDIAAARGFHFPGGKRQERALSIIPFLARHGTSVLDAMRVRAAEHAAAIVVGRGAAQRAAPR
jgi:bacillithiol biosynthesis cysteine-adding enzyme BshC